MKKMIVSKRKKKPVTTNKINAHKCNVCQKTFPKLSLLERHLRTHSGEKPYVCSYCNRGFAQNGTLQIHLTRHKGLKPFSCTLCPAKFNQKGNLRVHIKKTHLAPQTGEQVFKCVMCTCIFKRVSSLNAHITKAHANASKESDEISKVMEQLSKLERTTNAGNTEANKNNVSSSQQQQNNSSVVEAKDDVNKGENDDESETRTTDGTYVRLADSSVDGEIRRYLVKQVMVGDTRVYVCSYCERQFKKPSDLIRHIRIHTREKPFKCKQCNQAFSVKSTLVSHFNTHLGRRDYKCMICLKMFTSVRTLNAHIKKHNNRNQKPLQQYKCSMCNKTFSSQMKANAHLSVHNQNGKEAELKEEIVMKQPMLETANGLLSIAAPKSKFPSVELDEFKNRPFRCHLCTGAFNKRVHLRRHLLRHSGDRRFKCDYCPKAFYNAYSLKEHIRFHSGVKNYTCRMCNKKFVTSTILKRHYSTHSSYRPYICPYCKKRFTTVILCRKHIKVHKKEILKSMEKQNSKVDEVVPPPVNIQPGGVEDFVMMPLESCKKESVIVSIAGEGGVQKKVMELPLEPDFTSSVNLLQDNVTNILNQQLYQLPLDVVQDFGVNETSLENTVTDPTNNQVSLYINYDDLQTLNTDIYGQLLPQTTQMKLQNEPTLLNELADPNAVFSLDNFAETQAFQENFGETVDLNMLLNKPVTGLTTDVPEVSVTLPNPYETAKCDEKTSTDKTIDLVSDLNLPVQLTNVGTSALPIFTSLDSNLCETASVICATCGVTTTVKGLETHDCIQNLPPVTIEKVDNNSNVNTTPNNEEESENGDILISGTSITCLHCNKKFQSKRSCLKHIALHKNRKPSAKEKLAANTCQYCMKVFKKPSDLKRHLRTHTGEKPFSCAQCSKSFSLKSTLEAHIKTHNPQSNKDFNCQVCNSCFSSKSSLKVHTALHTGAKPYACNICDAKFRTSAHRRLHERSHDKGTNRSSNTEAANLSNLLGSTGMMDANVLADNLMGEGAAATDEILFVQNPLSGDQTNMTGSDNLINDEQLNVLNQTIQIDPALLQQLQNSGLLLQDSLVNDLVLTDQLQLDPEAMKLPSVEISALDSSAIEKEKFKCDICGKSYNTKAVLRKHKKIHGDGIEFRCNLCNKGFKNTTELERHNKVHLGARPYSCHFCNNAFSDLGSLKTHMKRIHKMNNVADALMNYIEQDDFINKILID